MNTLEKIETIETIIKEINQCTCKSDAFICSIYENTICNSQSMSSKELEEIMRTQFPELHNMIKVVGRQRRGEAWNFSRSWNSTNIFRIEKLEELIINLKQ